MFSFFFCFCAKNRKIRKNRKKMEETKPRNDTVVFGWQQQQTNHIYTYTVYY